MVAMNKNNAKMLLLSSSKQVFGGTLFHAVKHNINEKKVFFITKQDRLFSNYSASYCAIQ
jgi:hypothetical protein